MRKVIAILLVLVMLFALVSCGAEKADTADTAPAATEDASKTESAAETPAASEGTTEIKSAGGGEGSVGWFTDDVDHFARDPYKIAYVLMSMSAMTANFSNSLSIWAERLNVEYNDYSANDDQDAFITTIETYAAQGYDGFIIDFSDTVMRRCLDLMSELGLPYMSGMVSAHDDDGKLAAPSISFDMYQFGVDLYDYLMPQAKAKWGDDIDFSKCGFITVDFSAVYEIAQRATGFYDCLNRDYPELAANNYWNCDMVAQGGMSAECAYNEVAPVVSAHPEFEHWIISGCIDDSGQGAARVFETAGRVDDAIVACVGGETLITEWDAGYEGCWISAYYTAQMIYTEGIICGLVAMIDGRATAETLWPTHIPEGEKYAQITLPSVFLEHEDYTEYLEWTDQYTGCDLFPYEYHGGDYAYTLEFR